MSSLIIKPTSGEITSLIVRVLRALDPGIEISIRPNQNHEKAQFVPDLDGILAIGEVLKGCDIQTTECVLSGGNTNDLSCGDNWRLPR